MLDEAMSEHLIDELAKLMKIELIFEIFAILIILIILLLIAFLSKRKKAKSYKTLLDKYSLEKREIELKLNKTEFEKNKVEFDIAKQKEYYEKVISDLNKKLTLMMNENTISVKSSSIKHGSPKSITESINEDREKANLICSNLYIFEMSKVCWKCHKNTRVICLATNNALTLFDDSKTYSQYKHLQLLSYVTNLPDHLASYLKEKFKYYPAYVKKINSSYYINHCEHCNSIQGDNFLHEVPKDAFYKNLYNANLKKSNYYKIKNRDYIKINAQLPCYDDIANSFDLIMLHMENGIENRASARITQKLMDTLIEKSNYLGEISVDNL